MSTFSSKSTGVWLRELAAIIEAAADDALEAADFKSRASAIDRMSAQIRALDSRVEALEKAGDSS